MASSRPLTAILLVVAVATVVIFGYYITRSWRQAEPPSSPTIRAEDPVRGPAGATVTIIAFGDFQCDFCGEFADAIGQAQARYPGQVREVWKDFPLAIHPQARSAALSARCANTQGKFWEFHDAVFALPAELDASGLQSVVGSLGLDQAQFNACLADPATSRLVDQATADGRALGITGVPTFFLNGQRYDEAIAAQDLVALVGAELVGSR